MRIYNFTDCVKEMSDSGESAKAQKKREYNRNAQRLFRQRRKEHLKNLEQAEKERESTHLGEVERLRREVNELRLENESLRLNSGSVRDSPVAPATSSPSSYETSPIHPLDMYAPTSHTSHYPAGSDPTHQGPHSMTQSQRTESDTNLCVLFPRDIAEVRRDLHEMLAPVLDLNVLQDTQLHLSSLAALGPTLPPSLQPTLLQLHNPHIALIDLIPSPSLRNRLIEVGFDVAKAFLTECCAFAYETEDRGQLIIWGEDHLSEFSWEFSADVLEKWHSILGDEWRIRANFWRRQRNASLLPLRTVSRAVSEVLEM